LFFLSFNLLFSNGSFLSSNHSGGDGSSNDSVVSKDVSSCISSSRQHVSSCVGCSGKNMSSCVGTSGKDMSSCIGSSRKDMSSCIGSSGKNMSSCVGSSGKDMSSSNDRGMVDDMMGDMAGGPGVHTNLGHVMDLSMNLMAN